MVPDRRGVDPRGMETTRTSDPTRAGAVWVTATGSFLLFAAAVTLVAVRWDSIPDGVKLGALAALSGGLLLAGRQETSPLARQAPAAANVLFHLGAFLAPVTAAAVLVHLELPRDELLLVLGATSAVVLHLLGRLEDSVVLGWGAAASVVVAATGLGGLTPVPATGWLVLLAGAALVAGRGTAAGAWAVTATFGPLVALAGDGGLSPDAQATIQDAVGTGLAPAVVGAGAAVVLLALAHRRKALPLAALAGVALVGGGAVAWQDLDPSPTTQLLAAAAVFAAVEAACLLLRRDPFWARPVEGLTKASEAVALVVAPLGFLAAVFLPLNDALSSDGVAAHPGTGAAFALAAVAWFLADLRRQQGDGDPGFQLLVGGGTWFAELAAVSSIVGAVAVGTASMPAAAAVAAVLAVALVLSGRAASPVAVPALVLLAIELVDAWVGGPSTAVAAAAGTLLIAFQATLHSRTTARALAMTSLLPAAVCLGAADHSTSAGGVILVGLLLATVTAVVLDQARSGEPLGWIARIAGTGLLLGLADQDAWTVAVVSGAYVVLATFEGLRRDDPWPLVGWAIGLPLFAGSVVVLAGLTVPQSGIVLASLALPFALAGQRWPVVGGPLQATAVTLGITGLGVAALDPGVLGTVLILDGLMVLAVGLLLDEPSAVAVGGVAAVFGTWQHLSLGGVESIDLYALPVAALLWLVGSRLADPDTSSWVTHAPAIALAGGTALAERIGGGGGGHALLAGAVGLVAVVEGGGRRLAAPLLLGTGLLVALTAHETTAVTAGVPTWAWLAAGGTLLVGAGLTMEHHELGPVETGRRLVDVVNERFH